MPTAALSAVSSSARCALLPSPSALWSLQAVDCRTSVRAPLHRTPGQSCRCSRSHQAERSSIALSRTSSSRSSSSRVRSSSSSSIAVAMAADAAAASVVVPVVDKETAANNPGLVEDVDPATKPYIMQQTMYRIKDPKTSLQFYSNVLGMRLLKRLDFPNASFSLYFMGYENAEDIPTDETERIKWTFSRRATIELTHNWGTESDPEFKGYHNGNTDPRGWGHIGVMVDDVYKACERFEKLGVEFVKKPDDGRMKGLAFIKDPDGYWIEIFDTNHMASLLTPPPPASTS